MDQAHIDLLRDNHGKLRDSITPSVLDVLEYLESHKIITEPMKERVEHESKVPRQQASSLLYLLRSRGKYAFQALYDAVVDSGLYVAADILKPECAPHQPLYESQPVLQIPPSPSAGDISEDEDLPDCWPLQPDAGDELYNKVRVKTVLEESLKSSTKKRLQDQYKYACSPKGQEAFYPLLHKKRGLCLIFSNEDFDHLEKRDGTIKDVTDLNILFTGLGFEVCQFRNKKIQDMAKLLKSKALLRDHTNFDCFVLVILSHGANGVVFGTDGGYEKETNAPRNFLDVMKIRESVCTVPSLFNKPKLFFIQACRGNETDAGQSVHSSSSTSKEGTKRGVTESEGNNSVAPPSGGPCNSHPGDGQASGAASNPSDETSDIQDTDIDLSVAKEMVRKFGKSEDAVDAAGQTHPLLSDTFVAWSTTAGYVSYRNTKQGTWFIQAVVYIFSRFAYKHAITTLMTKVINLVSKGEVEKSGYKQVCEYTPTMGKSFHFFPNLYEEE